jgi:glycosyltransferase involved in cell wall biosynthesis
LKIVVIGTACWTFEKFRGSLLRKLVLQGNEVIAIGTNRDQASLEFLETIGVRYYDVNFDKGRSDILSMVSSLSKILKIFRKHKPDVCLAYFLKPIVVASFAKFFYQFRLISLIEGLGHTFTGKNVTKYRRLAKYFLQFTLQFSDKVICLNIRDKEELFSGKESRNSEQVLVLPGIGVDLKHYKLSEMPRTELNFLFLSRLLKAKGLPEFIGAAVEMKSRAVKASFSVYGQVDDSVHGVETELLERLNGEGVIHYGGLVHDVRQVIESAHVLVLPTFYREGLPRCIQEAMAMGRPVITTDFSGCSGIIKGKVNGCIVDSRNIHSLVEAMEWFCSNKEKFESLSLESRNTAERHFDCDRSDEILQNLLCG